LKSESTCFPIFLVGAIFKAGHVVMHGWFLEETSGGEKVLQCPSQYFDTVVKNYASTFVKRGVGGVKDRLSLTVTTHPTNSFGPTTPPSPPTITWKKKSRRATIPHPPRPNV
jgi:hypothetical protein